MWYASFVAKPELDFVIETNLNTKYSSTIENIFSSHLQRLVTRKHTVPKFKARLKSKQIIENLSKTKLLDTKLNLLKGLILVHLRFATRHFSL